jgi:uncharacterized protein YndB with AHSA1/START domain
MAAGNSDDTTIVITREFAAPRALVFEAWTKAEHLAKWFAPDNFTLDCDVDFRPGGALRLRMVGYGMDHTARGTYREIVQPERIVLVMGFDDVPGVEFVQTITFAEKAGGTLLTMRQEFPPWDRIPEAHRPAMRMRFAGSTPGWNQTLQHLADFVAQR